MFLADPQPENRWVSTSGCKRPRSDPDWPPFNGPLSPASQGQAQVILNSMFTWVVDAGYLRRNPMALLRQRAKSTAPRVTRYLSISLSDEVKSFVGQLPQDTGLQKASYARCRCLPPSSICKASAFLESPTEQWATSPAALTRKAGTSGGLRPSASFNARGSCRSRLN